MNESTKALKEAAKPAPPAEGKQSLAAMLASPKVKNQIALALPKHMSSDRLARIATTEMRRVPKLAQCDQMSFIGAIMQCAQMGLEPGGVLGHVYLIPFDKKEKINGTWQVAKTEVQVIIGYRGMIDLARRSGQIESLSARAVFSNDEFSYQFGLHEDLTHKPASGNRGELVYVYAVARLKDGGVQFEVMSHEEVCVVRNASQGWQQAVKFNKADSSPWGQHFEEMAKKTVIRRLFKWLPVSIELQQALELEQRADEGLSQENELALSGEFSVVEDAPQIEDNTAPIGQEILQGAIDDPFLADYEAAERNSPV